LLAVTEAEGGIHVCQDRFLETGPTADKDSEPIHLSGFTADGSKVTIEHRAILDTREKSFAVDTSKPFELDAKT
ncbi:hypothetical protein BJ138DRAFT_980977, partial [Hygrophoropsis aurantiaca]